MGFICYCVYVLEIRRFFIKNQSLKKIKIPKSRNQFIELVFALGKEKVEKQSPTML